MVLPGAQALLGFQFIAFLAAGYDDLPDSSKQVHLVSLLLIALTTVLLMTPAAYHRLVAHGENTEDFYQFAGRMVLAAMVPLALGISSDLFVVARKVTNSIGVAASAAALTLGFCYGLWFAFMYYRRSVLDAQMALDAPAERQGKLEQR
jgi:hypothetical protein